MDTLGSVLKHGGMVYGTCSTHGRDNASRDGVEDCQNCAALRELEQCVRGESLCRWCLQALFEL